MMNAKPASVRRNRARVGTVSLDILSGRERQVLDGIMRGLTNKGIGLELGISHRTVEIHRARLMRKLNVSSLAALLAIALPQADKLGGMSAMTDHERHRQ